MSHIGLKAIPKFLKEKRIFNLILGLVLIFVLLGFFVVIYQENVNAVGQFNQQMEGLGKTSTNYLVKNYELYGSPLTIKYQNIINGFLEKNNGVEKFKIFDTEGQIVFDSTRNEQAAGNVEAEILNLSRNDKISTVMEGNKIKVLVSPHFEEWGTHKYSILLYPSYLQLNKEIWQFNIEIGAITVLLILSIIAIFIIFSLSEQNKAHKKEKERLEILNRQRQEFMMLVAHNLRTPLTIIKGYLSFLLEAKATKDQEKQIKPIVAATNDLSKLVENILAITTVLGQPNNQVTKEKVVFQEFIDHILKEYHKDIGEKKLIINQSLEPKNLSIYVDKQYTEIIFQALISNAIKYNKLSGKLTINAEIKDGKSILSIADTGVGIKTKEQGGIFTQFHKSDSDGRGFVYNYEGAGIGLYMSKLLVEHMSGEIWFESEEGKGTTFYVSLPLEN